MALLPAGTTFAVLLGTLTTAPDTPCVGAPGAPALDHVIIAVADLDNAAASFARHGFRLKPGRLHANGLLNRHVKFPDGTEIELMTVRGDPGDAMAADYAALIAAGDGGAYVALRLADLDAADRAAAELGLETIRSASGPWRFLSFPPASPAAAVFFGSGVATVTDPDSVFAHAPRVEALEEVWVEAGEPFGRLLAVLGARRCGPAEGPDGLRGTRWGLARGTLVVVPARPGARPRPVGAVLRAPGGEGAVVRPHPAFWLGYR